MSAAERPLSAVPAWIAWLLGAALAAQLAWQALQGTHASQASDLPPAPSARIVRALGAIEPEALARILMLYVQAYDLRGDNVIPYQRLDYARLIEWLQAILETDPRSQYALFSAARVYTENPEPEKVRAMLEFLHQEFRRDPERRWQWLAHAALVARHRLGDLALARRYAQAIDRHVRDARAPLWARQMEIFILEDMNELEAAKIMLGGLIEGGQVRDPSELRFLRERLQALERRLAARR